MTEREKIIKVIDEWASKAQRVGGRRMTDKEKQIEEMAKIISSLCDMPYCDTCYAYKEYNGCTERKNAEE